MRLDSAHHNLLPTASKLRHAIINVISSTRYTIHDDLADLFSLYPDSLQFESAVFS